MNSQKYNRTQHFPFSPGKGNDDKVSKSVDSLLRRPIVLSEKLDGSNCSLEADGVFARTHAHAPSHPSFDILKQLHANIKHLIDGQYFGENVYARHSISYDALPGYFLLFAIRYDDLWASWSHVCERANELEIPTVPVLWQGEIGSAKELETLITELAAMPSDCGGEREGIVVRVEEQFNNKDFDECVMKFVRANHVNTPNEHWAHKEIIKNGLKKV